MVLLPPNAFSGLKISQKCGCGRGSTPDPSYSTPPDPLTGLEGLGEEGGSEWEGKRKLKRGGRRTGPYRYLLFRTSSPARETMFLVQVYSVSYGLQ